MIREPVLECAFLIPIRQDKDRGDGELHSVEDWQWLLEELFLRFRGATISPGLFRGFYQDPDTGQRVDDASRQYVVALPTRQLAELRDLLGEACRRFQQKCIYLSVAGEVEFIEASDDGPN